MYQFHFHFSGLTTSFATENMPHIISTAIGIFALWSIFDSFVIYQILLTFIAWITLHISNELGHSRGLLCSILCISYNLACEVAIVNHTEWHKIVGAQMVLSMKLISLAFDLDFAMDQDKKENEEGFPHPSIFEYFGYALCPGNTIFGPWIPYKDYLNIFHNSVWVSN